MRARPGRWTAVAVGLGLVAVIAIVPTIAAASGGGGCGQPVTAGAGSEVDIEEFCFAPTILRVAPGDVVTFANLDPTPHSVLGANATWGDYAGFKKHDVLYRFSEPGVYPYVCTYHPGMLGAVVVGNGVGDASGATTADGPVTRVTASELEVSKAAALTVPAPRSPELAWQLLLAGLAGILVGSGGTLVVERRRQRRPTA